MCHSPASYAPSQSCSSQVNTLDEVRENGSCTAGKTGCPLTTLISPHRINHGLKDLSDPKLCRCGWGVMWARSNCSSYPLQCVQTHILLLTLYWNFSTRNLDFHKGGGWWSKIVFFQELTHYSLEGLEPETGHCRVHSQHRGLYAYYLTHSGQSSFLVPWHTLLYPSASTNILLSINGYQIVIVWWRGGGHTNEERLIQSCCWSHSKPRSAQFPPQGNNDMGN